MEYNKYQCDRSDHDRIDHTDDYQCADYHHVHLAGVQDSFRQQLVDRTHILGESVENPAAWVSIKETHPRVDQCVEHQIMQTLVALHARLVEEHRPGDTDNKDAYYDACVDVNVRSHRPHIRVETRRIRGNVRSVGTFEVI